MPFLLVLGKSLGHFGTTHGFVFRQVLLNDCLIGIDISIVTRIVESRHGVQVRIDRIKLHLAKDFIVLATIAKETANHPIKVPRILNDGSTFGNTLESLLFVVIAMFGLHLDIVVNARTLLALFVLTAANKSVGVVRQVEVLLLDVVTLLLVELFFAPAMLGL